MGNFPVDLFKDLCACVSNCGVELSFLECQGALEGHFSGIERHSGPGCAWRAILGFLGSAGPFDVVFLGRFRELNAVKNDAVFECFSG